MDSLDRFDSLIDSCWTLPFCPAALIAKLATEQLLFRRQAGVSVRQPSSEQFHGSLEESTFQLQEHCDLGYRVMPPVSGDLVAVVTLDAYHCPEISLLARQALVNWLILKFHSFRWRKWGSQMTQWKVCDWCCNNI